MQETVDVKRADTGKLRRLWFTNFWRYPPKQMDKDSPPSIHDLYPHLAESELKKAEDNLEQYLVLVLRIFERVESDENSEAAELTPENGTLRCTLFASKSS